MYALVGVTGKIGGHALKYLSEHKHHVRAILRDDTKSAMVLAAGNIGIFIGYTSPYPHIIHYTSINQPYITRSHQR